MFSGLFGGIYGRRSGRTAARGRATPEERDPFAPSLRLIGDRVLLRALSADDAEAMFAFASDPEVTRYLPWEPAVSVESVRPFLEDQVLRWQRHDSLGFAIVLRETGQMIGSTDLMELHRTRGQAELGYLIARPWWGQGLMTEAARLTAAHAFGALRIGRLVAFADVENYGSRRVLDKLGMHVSGSEMRNVRNEDRLYLRHEIRRADWLARQK